MNISSLFNLVPGIKKRRRKKMVDDSLKQEYVSRLERLAEYYGLEESIPSRILERLDKAIEVEDETLRKHSLDRVYQAMEVHALTAWSDGKATGPNTPENLEVRAKKAESIVKLLRTTGKPEKAEEQLRKAEEFRRQAAELRATRNKRRS